MEQKPKSDSGRLAAAVISLGLATVGTAVAPALQYGCIPIMAYLTIRAAQDTYKTFTEDGRIDPGLVESTVVGFTLIQGHYLAGSLACSLYRGSNKVWQAIKARSTLSAQKPLAPMVARVRHADIEIEVPVDRLQIGDTVIVHSGEIIPVNGKIITGSAWIAPESQAHKASWVIKRPDACVYARQLVLAGSIHIAVQSA